MSQSGSQNKLIWLLIAILGFAGWGLSQLQADVAVSLVGKSVLGSGNYTVSSEVAGTIDQVLVDEGDAITAGQALIRLRTDDLDDEILAVQQELAGQQDILSSQHMLKDMYQKELVVVQGLAGEELVSAGELRDAERALTTVEAEIVAQQGNIQVLNAQIQKLENKRKKFNLVAATSGRVLNVGKRLPGEVVQAAEPLLVVVPDDGELLFEAKVPVPDIAAVSVGSEASISLMSVNRYEVQPFLGEVVYISPAAQEDEEGNLFFTSKIALLSGQSARPDAKHLQDIGQLADISVKSGQRSVLAYLLSPLVRGSEKIFTEK
jgi:multidrug resistance efflux pump